ncbi:hypothetical protein [Vibrio sp. 11986-1-5]|uniref:hypothetical protein n=1 Tax=Vibrio sp. 11986-1-5 TaxID=2211215 RepID=UPI00215A98AC|nr:hypothetical protein [Vibrio sp. 11986-1-5]
MRVNTMKYFNVLKKYKVQSVAVASTAFASFASNATVEESLTTAINTGQTNYTTVVIGLIALAAIGFGLRAIIRVMNS